MSRPHGSRNKPKVPTSADTTVAAGVATAGGGGAASGGENTPRARTREAFPKYRTARVADLIPYEHNARTHSPKQIDKLCRLIKEFGWTNPMLVAGKHILAGHARREAAVKLGMVVIPVIDLSHLNAAQRRAYILADNRAALDAGWDEIVLSEELLDLKDLGFDLSLTAFDDGDLLNLLGDESGGGLTDPDEVPPLTEPVTVPGDVWLLGKHRLVCGDSTTTEAVEAALAGVKPHLMVTDPPYGVEYDAGWNDGGITSHRFVNAKARGKVENDDRADWSEAWALFPGDVAYVWFASKMTLTSGVSIEASGFEIRSTIIWAKTRFALARAGYHWQHEPCWYAVRKGSTGHWSGDRKQTTLWTIDHQKSETGHSTQKPVECMKRPIENNSSAGQAVYDPFVGSGTSIIAAEMTGRACHAIELSPQYVDVALRRWQAFVGQEATLEGDGRTFAAIEAARAAKPARVKVAA